jgi:hypothetical protein
MPDHRIELSIADADCGVPVIKAALNTKNLKRYMMKTQLGALHAVIALEPRSVAVTRQPEHLLQRTS